MAKKINQPLELEAQPAPAELGNTSQVRRPMTAESEEYTPEIGVTRQRQAPAPMIDASPAFIYFHRPGRYMVMRGKVVPLLSKFKLAPGINGVDQDAKTGKPLPRQAVAELRESGVAIIPWDVQGPGTSYLRKPKGTAAVISQWERVYPGSAQVDCDEVGYTTFCRGLIDKGVVPAPPVFVLERMHAELVKQVEDLHNKPGQETLLRRLQADRVAVEQELEVQRRAEGAFDTEDFTPEEAA